MPCCVVIVVKVVDCINPAAILSGLPVVLKRTGTTIATVSSNARGEAVFVVDQATDFSDYSISATYSGSTATKTFTIACSEPVLYTSLLVNAGSQQNSVIRVCVRVVHGVSTPSGTTTEPVVGATVTIEPLTGSAASPPPGDFGGSGVTGENGYVCMDVNITTANVGWLMTHPEFHNGSLSVPRGPCKYMEFQIVTERLPT